MTLAAQPTANRDTIIETNQSLLTSVPLPFASVAFSDSYHSALLRNLKVDGGLVVFSRPADSFYVSSAVGFPPRAESFEQELSQFCRMIDSSVFKLNGNVIRVAQVFSHMPMIRRMADLSGYRYLRIYQINDFLAAKGYWLMFFRDLANASSAGVLINRSLSSPQFRDSLTEDILAPSRDEALDEIVLSWVTLLDKRDKETEEHTERVARMAVKLARRLGINGLSLKNLWRGALLHDIGKIVIPDEILYKPGPLTEDEWHIMRLHPKIVKDLLKNFTIPKEVLEIPFSHHEKWDGSGYPDRLAGKDIPLSARIFSLVDVWDAMRVDRPYRKCFPESGIKAYLQSQSGKHFDPEITPVFIDLIHADS
jgi:putative nucleotidyltransferase with HDIG domain